MCDPMTLGGIVLTGLSTAVNASSQSRIQNARDDALAAERSRQAQMDREGFAVNREINRNYKGVEKQATKKGKDLTQYFTSQKAQTPTESALPTSASNVTVQEEKAQRANAQNFTDRSGQALGQLRSLGDVLADNSLAQAQGASQIGQLGGFKRGSADVLSYELDDANHAGDGLKLFGDLLSGFGGIALQKGLSTPASAAAAPTTTLGEYLGAKNVAVTPGVPIPTPRPSRLPPTIYGSVL